MILFLVSNLFLQALLLVVPQEEGITNPEARAIVERQAKEIELSHQEYAEAGIQLDDTVVEKLEAEFKSAQKSGDLAALENLQRAKEEVAIRRAARIRELPTAQERPVATGELSRVALKAIGDHAKRANQLREDCLRQVIRLREKFVKELSPLVRELTQNGEIDDAKKVQDILSLTEKELALSRRYLNGSKGTIYLVLKGSDVALFQNGKEIAHDSGREVFTIKKRVTVYPGDVLVLQASSPFVNRAFRAALVLDDAPEVIELDCSRFRRITTDERPSSITAAMADHAQAPAQFRDPDAGTLAAWKSLGIRGSSEKGEWVRIPKKGNNYTFVCVIR